jgi:hypothetical protein
MAISDQTSCPADSCGREQHVTCVRAAVSKLLTLCAISSAIVVAGCAQNPGPRDVAASRTQVKIASASPTAPSRSHSTRHYAQARFRRLDPALLAPQPVPDCEYNISDLKIVDPDEWALLRAEYELQCYRDTEEATRARLGLLQSSVRHLQN